MTRLEGVRLGVEGGAESVNFDVKARLEERERKSQSITVWFSLLVTTRPSIVKFEVEGTATLTGKDEDLSTMLEVNQETKVPHVFQRIYQQAFTAMYLFSTVLNAPPPPHDLLGSRKTGVPVEGVDVEVEAGAQPAQSETIAFAPAPETKV